MNIRVLGCHGSQLPNYNTTCFLIGQNTLVDAGAITSVLSLREQQKIDYVFVTHAHLDHIRDLMFLADNIYYQRREKPLVIVGTKGIIDAIHRNLFNNVVWPDFSRIPNSKTPVIKFQIIKPGRKQQIGDLLVKAVNLHHSVETVGYIIEAEGKALIFMGDTGPTEEVWQTAGKIEGLKAVFIETSLPNRMSDVADKTGHLTPRYLAAELKKLAQAKPIIYLYHIKPIYRKIIRKEVAAIKDREIRIIEDGQKIRI
ncbi:MAG: 3',5'-cyclic-nucleotide phosphodiesterase [Syntrophaceae bacterium]|nr:3',5'-cyclic-nucleotide phosphodiesterase [Syntrophaceae bacterium]